MYIRGKLLFVGFIFSGHNFTVRDLHKQISRTRRDYRLGVSLPTDYKFRYYCNTPRVNLIYCIKLNLYCNVVKQCECKVLHFNITGIYVQGLL